MKKYLLNLGVFLVIVMSKVTVAAVILQYHHVSSDTPASTSISPEQFEAHMKYLADNNFRVVPLSDIMNSIKKHQAIPDKTIAITFDDAYTDILFNGKRILDKYNYPFTIFINPGIINQGSSKYLSWEQLKQMADDGVIIANHGYEHDSIARMPDNISEAEWLEMQSALLLEAEQQIADKTGQNWRYFAYPYGEFSPAIQQWISNNDFIAFSQQSGAVGHSTDLTSVPRFPASKPYDKIASLKDKLNSLPFQMQLDKQNAQTIYEVDTLGSVTFQVIVDDFRPSQLNCYVTGIGKQEVQWVSDDSFTIVFNASLPTARVRSNCTAPSISKPGRFYWYSKPWFILEKGKKWYPF